MKFVADNWNIKLYGVAGTSVERRVKDSTDIKNAELWKKLDQTKSTDSKKEFRKQVIAEMINIQNAQKILDSNKKAQTTIDQLKNSESDSYAELEFKKENGVYIWVIYSTEKDKYFGTSIAEFNAVVDLNMKLVEIEPIKKN
jgi:hypothetical protein